MISKKSLTRLLLTIGLGCSILALLFGIWVIWSIYTLDDRFKAEQDYYGDIKGIEGDFRTHFYGKTEYPAYSLEQLRDGKLIDQYSYELIKDYRGKYTPFSSNTPKEAVVLRFKFSWFDPYDVLTKGDLTADDNAPN